MISVIYDGGFGLEVQGHAGQAPRGHDVVCAGASTLFCSLAEMLVHSKEKGELISLDIEYSQGFGHVRAVPATCFESALRCAFDTVRLGYEHLAKNFPEHIRLTSDVNIFTDSPT